MTDSIPRPSFAAEPCARFVIKSSSRRFHDETRPPVTTKKLSLVLNPNPAKARLKELGGSRDDRWNDRLVSLVASAIPGMNDMDSADANEAANATIAGMLNINSADPVEGMLASQLIVANEASLSLYRRAWAQHADYFEARVKYLALADRAARTVAVLAERLDAHRSRGRQEIVVKHVTVNADQAVIADTVTTGRPAPAATPATAVLTASAEKPVAMLDGLDRALQRDPVGVGVQTK
jgi:hypothetical protein